MLLERASSGVVVTVRGRSSILFKRSRACLIVSAKSVLVTGSNGVDVVRECMCCSGSGAGGAGAGGSGGSDACANEEGDGGGGGVCAGVDIRGGVLDGILIGLDSARSVSFGVLGALSHPGSSPRTALVGFGGGE